MRLASLVLLLVFTIAACAEEFHKKRELTLNAEGIKELKIDCGAGFLKVEGVKDLEQIQVEADIRITLDQADEIDEVLEKYVTLILENQGSRAELICKFENQNSFFRRLFDQGFNGAIDLTIKMPYHLELNIDDGSGLTEIQNTGGSLKIDDGSGDMTITDVAGKVYIDDGSGRLSIEKVGDDVDIDDGSGETQITDVKGSVKIDDGSGDIRIKNITGNVRIDDGSGTIDIDKVSGDVIIENAGSGGVYVENVEGKVYREDQDDHRDHDYYDDKE
ncbi:MAG: hypothetical protein JXR46_10940 [Calditrichaceae bacterium]|nr:hypothetical protein [Calditrichaceae bacterium]MBN2709549.1 hypothetical protein [Calditrichaceae bacterium]RQV96810.1 MAG: hypothetical protein EH224_03340 [Calditrichota bacterium]